MIPIYVALLNLRYRQSMQHFLKCNAAYTGSPLPRSRSDD